MKIPPLRLGSLPPIRISGGTLATLLILALVVHPVVSLSSAVHTGDAIAVSLGIALFMIVSVLVHELAHALTARLFGASVDHIALTLWGGHTQYRAERMGGLPSMLISLAGPASNLLLAALCWALATLTRGDEPSVAALFWGYSAWLNVALAVFNLLPGLPMDGGRALEALLGAVLRDRVTGTRITAWLGRVIAVAVVAWPLWRLWGSSRASTGSLLTLVWALLIAGMLWHGASRALEAANLEHRIQHLDAAALARPVVAVPAGLPLAQLPLGVGADGADGADGAVDPSQLLVIETGPPLRAHRIDAPALRSVPPAHREQVPVSAVSAPIGTLGELAAGLSGSQLVTAMLARPHPLYVVRDGDGAVIGVIRSAEVNAVLRGR